jgi:DNA-binding CsgD family transcriptional regulator
MSSTQATEGTMDATTSGVWIDIAGCDTQVWAGAMRMLDALPSQAAVLDTTGRIVAVNAAWRAFAVGNGNPDSTGGLGRNYLAVCDASEALASLGDAIRSVLSGATGGYVTAYDCSAPGQSRWYQVRVTALDSLCGCAALVIHENVSEAVNALGDIWRGYTSLTARERQVFELVVAGLANKEMAAKLGVADKTIEAHRAAVMRKMQVGSMAELVRRAVAIEAAIAGCSVFDAATRPVPSN